MSDASAANGMSRRQALGTLAQALLAAPIVARSGPVTAQAASPRPASADSARGSVEGSFRDAAPALVSSALALTLRPAPYHFEIAERSTGRVILSHQATGLRDGRGLRNETRWARRARDVRGDSRSLSAALLAGEDGGENALDVRFELVSAAILKVTLRARDAAPDPTHDRVSITECFVDQGEHIYGLFEAAWPRRLPSGLYSLERGLDNRGVTANLLGNGMHGWFDGMRYSSARAPFYMTSRGYGIYTQSSWKAKYRLAVDHRTSFEVDDAEVAYFVIYGPSYAEILGRYNELAGPTRMPPDWALGPIWWRDDAHRDLRNPGGGRYANAQEVVQGDVRELARRQIPASAMWLDRPYARSKGRFGWGGVENGRMQFDASFPDPKGMIDAVRAAGLRLMVWIANRSDEQIGDEGKRRGYLLSTERAVDVRNPAARAWFQDKLATFVADGIQGYKIDRGEEGEVPAYLQNVNAALFPQTVAEGLARRYGGDYFVFARNLYDTGRRYAAVWNGDSYGWKGLRESVRQALRCALMNFPMWGSDTGGYGDTTPELFARWIEFAAYAPMMEILIGPERTPWLDFPPAILDIVVQQARIKHDLIPYLRSALVTATETGMPVMRPLFLAYPRDEAVRDLSDQYLLGPDLLVAPVVEKGARSREVYLPAGRWMDYGDRRTLFTGGGIVQADAPLSSIPVFVREGGIIPRGDVVKANNTWSANWEPRLRVEMFPSARGPSECAYYTGRRRRTIAMRPTPSGLRLDVDDLEARTALEVYCRRPRSIVRSGARLEEGRGYAYDEARQVLTIPLSGAATIDVQGPPSGARSLSVF